MSQIQENKKRQRGIELLAAAHTYDELIAIEQTYNLGKNIVGEFLNKNISKNFFAISNYTNLDCTSILQLLKNNKEFADKEMENAQRLQVFLGMEQETAKNHVEFIDACNQQKQQMIQENLQRIISGSVKTAANLDYVTNLKSVKDKLKETFERNTSKTEKEN